MGYATRIYMNLWEYCSDFKNQPLHTAAAPAIRGAVKTELSYQNDTVIVFFFAANTNKGNVNVALASYNS